ncbi:LOW QUALITY PROTEIN: cilia- and flagella-associated protein 276 [Tympanuchus pallidicinctus]|uniref:LOW QUALITY PROTEIN: cilia- and flagella-associated protein 276 n=1 Tax=Tympanuchus pallidicinctus TaxID=109042 RepID=UPI00228740D4|nr:LOW QUALITY PROTEIN: cilia- and flagella-associated protein 276 [Tympanuchus pallidicinctus]
MAGGGATPPAPPRPWSRLHAAAARCSRDHQSVRCVPPPPAPVAVAQPLPPCRAPPQPERPPEPWPRSWASPRKESVHRIQGRIECPHSAATNGGYSRKENGGFFCP